MEGKKIRLLLVEDDKIDQMAFERFARKENLPYDYTIAGSIAEAKKILKSVSFHVIISDYMLGDGTSFELFDQFKDLPVIVTTGTGNEEVAVEAMKLGAYDYIIITISVYVSSAGNGVADAVIAANAVQTMEQGAIRA